jgi:hypothetical protein
MPTHSGGGAPAEEAAAGGLGAEGPEQQQQQHAEERETTRRMVEFASVWHFCSTFTQPLKLRKFSPDALESAIVDPPGSLLLEEVHYRLLPVRPARFGDGSNAWVRSLKVLLYQNIEEFCRRYPEAIDPKLRGGASGGANKRKSSPRSASPRPSRPAKVFRKGERASRRLTASEGASPSPSSQGGDDDGDGDGNGNAAAASPPPPPEPAMSAAAAAAAYEAAHEDLSDLGYLVEPAERDRRNPLHTSSYFALTVQTRVLILKGASVI